MQDYAVNEMLEEGNVQKSIMPVSTNTQNRICQGNKLVMGVQNLTLNEKKLISLAFLQIMNDDLDFNWYKVSPPEFARLIGNSNPTNVYHHVKDLTKSLMHKQLQIRKEDGSLLSINWMSACNYNDRTKMIEFRLNSDLKPFLLGLAQSGYYTQYTADCIMSMSSVHAIRIFELIQAKIMRKTLPTNGVHVTLRRDEIVEALRLYKVDPETDEIIVDPVTKMPIERYTSTQLRERVIAISCREITKLTSFFVPYDLSDDSKREHCVRFIKEGREIVAFEFYVNMKYHEGLTSEMIESVENRDNFIKITA